MKGDSSVPALSLLKFEGKDGPVFFIFTDSHFQFGDKIDTPEEVQSHRRFFFEEHSCPTNWLGRCVAVIKNGNADPHGFLEFVRTVAIPTDLDVEEMDENIEVGNKEDEKRTWKHWFPEAFPEPKTEQIHPTLSQPAPNPALPKLGQNGYVSKIND